MSQYLDLDQFLEEGEGTFSFSLKGQEYTIPTEIPTEVILRVSASTEGAHEQGLSIAQELLGDEQWERFKKNTGNRTFQFGLRLILAKVHGAEFNPAEVWAEINGKAPKGQLESAPEMTEAPPPSMTSSGSGVPSSVTPVPFGVYPRAV